MQAPRFSILASVLLVGSCSSNGSTSTLPVNAVNQRLAVSLLTADTSVSGNAGTAGGNTGGAGTTIGTAVNSTGGAGTGAAGVTGSAGATGAPTPYQTVAQPQVNVDTNLINGWGLAFNPAGPIWVAANGTGLATVYNAEGQVQELVVTIPVAAGGAPPSKPTGLVFNSTADFQGDKFIFSTEDGTIAGWQSDDAAVTRADNAGTSTIYKGLTLATVNGASRIYASDFHNGKVDVWDGTYAPVTTGGGFIDPNLPSGYAPFGIQALGGSIFVTYAKQDDDAEDDDKGDGNGVVDVYDFDGNLLHRLISGGALNSPWAVAVAPSDFGALSNALLIGNFGDGHINAYDASTGALLGTALNETGGALVIDGLWALAFGNDTAGAAHNQLFFTAGPQDEAHGAFGRLDLFP